MKRLCTSAVPSLLGLLMLALAGGCGRDFTTEQPAAKDLIGEYVPTSDTLKRLQSEGYPHRDVGIILSADGQLTLRNIPDCWLDDWSKPHGKFDSGRGRWEVVKNYSVWAITFDIRSFSPDSAYKKSSALGYHHAANVVHNRPPYGLAIALAAGDDGYLNFQRK